MNIAKSVFKILISRTGKSLIGFLAIVIFSRRLGASSIGIYYSFIALLGLLSIPADFGISSATEKRISEGTDESSYLGGALILKIPIIIIISGLIFFSRDYVNYYLGAELAVPLVATLIIGEMGNLTLNVLRGELRVGETAIVEIIRPLCWLVLGYILYTYEYGVHGLVYGYLIGTLLMLLFGWWRMSTKISYPTTDHLRSLFDFGKYSIITTVGSYVYSWIDVAILTFFVVRTSSVVRGDIGAYENAWRLSLVVLVVSRSIGATVFPQFSRWSAENTTDRIEEMIPTVALPSLLVVIPGFVGITILSKDLLRILYGPEFTVAWLALIILAAEKILQSVHGVIARPLQAIDRPDLAAYATIISIITNVILNIILILEFGIVGAAIATAISFAINTLLHAYYLNMFLQINIPLRESGWCVVASIVMGISVYQVRSIVDISTIIDLLGIVGIGIVIYSAVLLTYKPIRSLGQQILKTIIE